MIYQLISLTVFEAGRKLPSIDLRGAGRVGGVHLGTDRCGLLVLEGRQTDVAGTRDSFAGLPEIRFVLPLTARRAAERTFALAGVRYLDLGRSWLTEEDILTAEERLNGDEPEGADTLPARLLARFPAMGWRIAA